jgi:hypothetical protein
METDSTGTEANQSTKIEENNTTNTTMAESVLVSNDFENETYRTTKIKWSTYWRLWRTQLPIRIQMEPKQVCHIEADPTTRPLYIL